VVRPPGLILVPTSLVTARLALREFTVSDVDDLLQSDGDARVMRYLANGLAPRTREEVAAGLGRAAKGYAERPGYGLLHASRRDDGRFVGGCGLFKLPDGEDVEIAYRLPLAWWGHGYATEMAGAVLAHAFDTLELRRVIGLTWPENGASQRVLRKIGMREEGVAEHYGRPMQVFVAERRA
jgi:RimJ/RimL family protein N-acetyltransferase